MATALSAALLGAAPALAATAGPPVVVVEPPPDESSRDDRVVLAEADESTPVGFLVGYAGLTALSVAVVALGRRRSPGSRAPAGLGDAYGRRAAADFWAERGQDGAGTVGTGPEPGMSAVR